MNTAPKRFVICTTARSGSNLVCDYIAITARLGKPTEFLNPDIVRRGAYGRRFDAPEPISLTDYVKWVATTHATPNGELCETCVIG
ncbi:Stf0 family sulfotransferase [Roseomonas rosulenta]|uniref:Stf0 family sulfotransferase n=1 Tax=Roseomonas rosulenta TaxID=2748667 RepID=UPI0018DF872A|nr:Stf0 family sulfotransferase [Roseomonas rosulenta]